MDIFGIRDAVLDEYGGFTTSLANLAMVAFARTATSGWPMVTRGLIRGSA
jgi:hypothetical protein